MRTVFLLLLLANLAFFAYGSMVRDRAQAHPAVEHLQLHPGKIRLIAPGDKAPAAPREPAASTPAVAVACLEWGAVAGADVGRADAAIAVLNLPESRIQRTVLDAGGYWVYLPPAKAKTQLERNLAELSALGVMDHFVVQDPTPWRNAISLGIFKTEEAAKGFLAALQAKGVKTAVVGRRENFLRQIAYFVREPDAATVARLAELQREFPGTQMKAVPCPGPTAALSP
ncbi:MAG: hypothetical protein ACT4PS_05035 [Betaproteobacteria bacterium]